MTAMERIAACGIIPVAVLDEAEKAVPTANALLSGGIDVIEITFRTKAAAESISLVSKQCPDMLVGAGTVLSLEQCRLAVDSGASFIVSPGFDPELVSWCVERGVPVMPGCATPTEIMAAMRFGFRVLKFFPANIYGGLKGIKALAGPFPELSFVPTGGINAENIGEYMASPHVFAVGGSWICSKKDIADGNFEKITRLSREAKALALGYELCHIGINSADASQAEELCSRLAAAFDFPIKSGNSSLFVSPEIEVLKSPGIGEKGHIAVRTNRIALAVSELEKRGFQIDRETAKYKNGKLTVVYLKHELAGFGIHLLQK